MPSQPITMIQQQASDTGPYGAHANDGNPSLLHKTLAIIRGLIIREIRQGKW